MAKPRNVEPHAKMKKPTIKVKWATVLPVPVDAIFVIAKAPPTNTSTSAAKDTTKPTLPSHP
jgi:hypothetical protein